MKKMDLRQMEVVHGGVDTDCTAEQRLIKLGVATAVGALAGPFGLLGGLYLGLAYDAYSCGWK